MNPETIALIFQILNLAIKEAPEVLGLVNQFKAALGDHEACQQTLKQITDGTIQCSNDTLLLLAPLMKKAV